MVRRAEESYRQRLLKRQLIVLMISLASIVVWTVIYFFISLLVVPLIDGTYDGWFFSRSLITGNYTISLLMEIFMIVFIAMTLISILTCVEYARELKILHKGYTRKTEEFQRLRELRDMHKNGYSFESMMLSEKEAKKLKKHRKIVAKNIYGEDVKSKFFSNPNIKKQVKAAVESAKRNVF